MKKIFIGVVTLLALNALGNAPQDISGTISLAKGLESSLTPNGVLFVFAKNVGSAPGNGAPPVAVLRIAAPQFPVKFSIGEQNAMMPGTPFKGPFSIYARYAAAGDAMDKSGPQGTDEKHKSVTPGQKNVSIELKAKN